MLAYYTFQGTYRDQLRGKVSKLATSLFSNRKPACVGTPAAIKSISVDGAEVAGLTGAVQKCRHAGRSSSVAHRDVILRRRGH